MKLVLFEVKAGAGSSVAAAAAAAPAPASVTSIPSARLHVGVLTPDDKHVADVTAAYADKGVSLHSMRTFLELGEAGFAVAREALATPAYHVARDVVTLRAPIYDPEKLLCVGMNYVDHCTEQNLPIPVEPVIFSKFPSCIIADGEPIVHPRETTQLDYEVELAIVIGKAGRRIAPEVAMSHVAGFTVAHDVSARDWQLKKNGGQWLLGKAADGFAPLGPCIVTTDEIGARVHELRLRTLVNGVVLQDGNTRELVHKTEAMVAWISKLITLKPGDVILTGTPPGVGCFRKPEPIWLHPGDVVTVEIEGIGAITNPIIADA